MSNPIDPFKHIGAPSTWGKLGEGEHDMACEAERRALCGFLSKRLAKGCKRADHDDVLSSILAGGMTGFAGLFVIAGGGADHLTEEDFEKFISVATFAWYQAISCFGGESVQ